MNLYINEQVAALGISALLGAALALVYDIFRILRHHVRAAVVTAVCDLVFWVLSAGAFFLFTMTVTGGVLRLYTLFGMGAGLVIWFLSISPMLLSAADAIINTVCKVLRFIFRPFAAVLKFANKILGKILKKVKNLFQIGRKKCIIDVSIDSSVEKLVEVTDDEKNTRLTSAAHSGNIRGSLRRNKTGTARPRNRRGKSRTPAVRTEY